MPVKAEGVSEGGTSLSLWLSDESESEWRGLCQNMCFVICSSGV